jgi:hypothetical protein
MRIVRKILLWGCLALAGATAFTYILDDLWARSRGRPVEQVKVDRVYRAINHWNQLEYSLGTPVMQTCVDSLMPHFGDPPCWYLKRHTLQYIGNP